LSRLPRLPRALLKRLLPEDEREFILGDLEELHTSRSASGESATRVWLRTWRETLVLVAGRRRLAADDNRMEKKGDGIVSSFWQDVRFSFRMLGRSRAFTLTSVLILGLGIGANATIFSWLNTVLITLLPGVDRAQELVALMPVSPMRDHTTLSYPDYVDFRDRTKTLEGLVVSDDITVNLAVDGEPERVWGQLVSGNFFDVLHVKAVLGRTFLPEEDRERNARPVVVISHSLFTRRFGADPEVVGRDIPLNGRPYTVVGVVPPGFQGSEVGLAYHLWVPMMMQESVLPGANRLDARGNSWLDALGRLKPGVGIEDARAELDTIAKQMAAERGDDDQRRGARVTWLAQSPRGAPSVLRPILLALLGLTAVVLLIACANVANLLLARAAGRRKEIAVRLALGASRGKILRQLLTESAMLATLGGAAGIAVAYFASGLLRELAPPTEFPIGLALGVDARVLAFTMALALASAVVFGLAPALSTIRASVVTPLKEEAAGVAGGGRKAWLRSALVLAQVALSLVLLVAAGLFLRSLKNARAFSPGFDPKGVLIASLDLFPSGYTSPKGRAFYRELLPRLRALPGVESVSLARRVPLGLGGSSSSTIEVEGFVAPKDDPAWTYINNVGPDYFRTIGITLLRGREFTDADDAQSPPLAIINEAMARSYWAEGDALGKRFSFGDPTSFTVVGIVADSKYRSLDERPAPFTYLPVLQYFRPDVRIHVRTASESLAMAASVEREVHALDPGLPVFDVRLLEEHIGAAFFQQRMAGSLLSVMGALTLLLAAVGLYGVVAYVVSQRTREIGIRMALGAAAEDIWTLVVRQGMWLVGVGLILGIGAAAGVSHLLRSLLFGTGPMDPLTYAGVVVLLAGVAFVACYVPARRATRVDPVSALRYE